MSTLPSLLPPSGMLLSYSLPLLFASLSLTFAGTFLTLDRTRTFPRAYDAIVPGSFDKPARPKPKDLYSLGGGVGGLVSGWCFGVHFTTFLALLIPSVSQDAPLSGKSFVPVWLISSVITAAIGGRWRYSAIAFSGLTGGCLFSLLLSVLMHPSLTTRLVMTAVFTPLVLLLSLLPFPTIQYATLRLANGSTGAVGVVMSIALMAHEPNWGNVWERYWVADGDLWASGKEKGLSAAACIFLTLGIATDWLLKRKFGQCPDQQWDSYLSRYSANLPDRAGHFAPARTLLDKLFHGSNADDKQKDIVFPDEHEDSKLKQGFLGAPPAYDMRDVERHARPVLKKGRSQTSSARFSAKAKGGGKKREAIKFRPLGEPGLSSDDDDTDDDIAKAPLTPTGANTPQRPWLKTKSSVASSTRTLVNDEVINYDKDIEALKRTRKKGFGDREIPDYSDGEDITETSSTAGTRTPRRVSGGEVVDENKDWSPKFLQNQKRQRHDSHESNASFRTSSSGHTSSAGFKPVPATPSLIKAIDRVQAAQRAAYGDGLPKLDEEEVDVTAPVAVKKEEEKKEEEKKEEEEQPTPHGGWTSFWRDVEKQNKANRDVPLRRSSPPTFTQPQPHSAQTHTHDRRSLRNS